ncbi:cytochrome p450 ii f2-like protein ii [Plakobranchus ocellatus]|uniref:Cytochrome p450 ii f2-like protein ii n=1 Tax=Plakobranchus ocellatus TaxID=259542 RepID=A0AAV4BSI7_9GAST|nr:cytochrome p450 ii f2-like protein ii [Plakobranchus ocellatus]
MSTPNTDDQWLGPVLAYTAVVIGVIYLVKSVIRPTYPANIPPFPEKPYPILGHLPYLAKGDRRKKLLEWRKTTGDIFSVCFGSQIFVVINGYKLVKEALVKNAEFMSARPPLPQVEGSHLGIVFANGAMWKEQRTISLSILRSFGMGKSSLSSKISEEVCAYLDTLAALEGKPKDVATMTSISLANIICSIIVGRRFEYTDPFFMSDKFIELNEEQRKKGEAETFITSYLDEMEKLQKQGKETSIGKPCLRRVLVQLFAAGTDTTATTIIWFMLFMLHHPHIQNKVSVPHYCTGETKIQGYTIPANTPILPSLDSVLLDENIWENPLTFKPERFLDSEGALIKPDALIPFSIGDLRPSGPPSDQGAYPGFEHATEAPCISLAGFAIECATDAPNTIMTPNLPTTLMAQRLATFSMTLLRQT